MGRKPLGKPKKLARINLDKRREAIEWVKVPLSQGRHFRSLVMEVSDKWAIQSRVAEGIIREAMQEIEQLGETVPAYWVGQLVKRCHHLYERAIASGDLPLAIEAVKVEFTIRAKAAEIMDMGKDKDEEAILRYLQDAARQTVGGANVKKVLKEPQK